MGQLELLGGQPGTWSTTNFVKNMKLPVHRWFRYSAGYSAQWAESIIHAELGGEGRVLDPFVGSGTTLLAAQTAGCTSIGIESHPFVASIARSKLCWPASIQEFQASSREVITRARESLADAPSFECEPALLQKCYSAGNLGSLRTLQSAVEQSHASANVRALLWLALMAVLRPASHVGTAQWQYVLPNKSKSKVSAPIEAYMVQCETMANDMATYQSCNLNPPSAQVIEDDVRALSSDLPECDLVLTSPPYANNFDYADATRLELTFLGEVETWADLHPLRDVLLHSCTQHMTGYDGEAALASVQLECIREELTEVYAELAHVRMSRGGRKAYHLMIVGYFHGMALALQAIRESLVPGRRACLVIGDSAPYGVHVPVENWLGRLAIANGFDTFSFEKVRDRNIKWKNRKHRVPLHEGHLWLR